MNAIICFSTIQSFIKFWIKEIYLFCTTMKYKSCIYGLSDIKHALIVTEFLWQFECHTHTHTHTHTYAHSNAHVHNYGYFSLWVYLNFLTVIIHIFSVKVKIMTMKPSCTTSCMERCGQGSSSFKVSFMHY